MRERMVGGRSRVLGAVAGALVLGVTSLSPAAQGAPAAPASPALAAPRAPAEDWLRFEHHVTYDVDPAAEVVHVRQEATLTNQQPDEVVGSSVRTTFLPEIGLPVLAEVANLQATRPDGSRLAAHLEPADADNLAFAVVDLSPDLQYRDTQTVVITYDLPRVPPRSGAFFRVNRAFVSFPIVADGDPGLTTIEVRVPEPFAVEVVGDEMASTRDGDVTVLRATPEDPSTWFATVVARDDDELLSESIELGEHGAVVRAWPDDPEWAGFATTQVRDGVPALEDLIGLPWPATRSIDVLETAAPYLYGYAGWYQPLEGVIEVGDELDQHVMLHELSHLWFNADLFDSRWINEGLAEVFAAAAGARLGATPPEPDPIDPGAPGALALNSWENPDLEADISEEQEAYGYNAAWAVLDGVTDEVGIEALAEIVRAAEAGENPYGGPGFDDRTRARHRWTDLLDLLEIRAGSTTAAGLFAQHVATEDERADLDARAASRARYLAQAERSGTWSPPMTLRLALSDWRFGDAEALMGEVDAVLDQRDELVAALDGLDVTPADLETSYEVAADLDDVAVEADRALAAVPDLRQASRAADRPLGPLARVGLLFAEPEDDLARAEAAFERGDYEAARRRADEAVEAVDGATTAGVQRLVAAAIVLGLLVLAADRPRRQRRAREQEAEEARQVAGEDARREAEAWGPPPGDDASGPNGVRDPAR